MQLLDRMIRSHESQTPISNQFGLRYFFPIWNRVPSIALFISWAVILIYFVTFRVFRTVYAILGFIKLLKVTRPRNNRYGMARSRSAKILKAQPRFPNSVFLVTFRVYFEPWTRYFGFYWFVKSHVISKRPPGRALGQSSWRILKARTQLSGLL